MLGRQVWVHACVHETGEIEICVPPILVTEIIVYVLNSFSQNPVTISFMYFTDIYWLPDTVADSEPGDAEMNKTSLRRSREVVDKQSKEWMRSIEFCNNVVW